MRFVFLGLAATMLIGCVAGALALSDRLNVSLFRPFDGHTGYSAFTRSEFEVEVTFVAGLSANPSQLRQLALIRAAQLADMQGIGRLQVVSDSTWSVQTGERTAGERAVADTSRKNRSWKTVETTEVFGRRYAALRVRFCKDLCDPGISTQRVLADAVEGKILPDPTAGVSGKKQ